MKKYLSISLILVILSYQSVLGMELNLSQDSGVSKRKLKSLSYSLMVIGLASGAFGALIKFGEIELPPDENGVIRREKEYDGKNYALMSTGASCFIVGFLLRLVLIEYDYPSVGIYKINNDIGLMASIRF